MALMEHVYSIETGEWIAQLPAGTCAKHPNGEGDPTKFRVVRALAKTESETHGIALSRGIGLVDGMRPTLKYDVAEIKRAALVPDNPGLGKPKLMNLINASALKAVA